MRTHPRRIPTRSEGNDLYPLPSDYADLSTEGKRQARVNAARQGIVRHRSLDERGDAYVAALQFFDRYYLWPDYDADFSPMFYDMDPLTTPQMHLDIARASAIHWLALGILPRGAAKTTQVRKEIVHSMTAVPMWSCTYATSTNDNMMETGDVIKSQFNPDMNPRIRDDFCPEYDVLPSQGLIPPRGQAPGATRLFRLANGARFRGLSAKSKIRGRRQTVFYLDDPEYDESASTSMAELRRFIERLLFKVALPTIMREGGRLVWRATFISRRHYAWLAMSGKDTPEGFRAEDPRFNNWLRLFYDIYVRDKDGNLVSCWPEMWPTTRAERLRLAKEDPRYATRKSIEEIREVVGDETFNSEYRGRPGEGTDTYFGGLDERKHGWWFEDIDDLVTDAPFRSTTKLCWYGPKGQLHKMPLNEFVKWGRLFMIGDTSDTAGATSDFKAVALMAIITGNILFVLDLWGAKAPEASLVAETFKMADRWRCPLVKTEAIRSGISYYNSLVAMVSQKAKEMTGTEYLPSIGKISNMGAASKTAKIAGLHFRFEHGQIKLPLFRRRTHHWQHLFSQIEDFNPEIDDGGLQHDDHLDCVAMSQFVLRGRLNRSLPEKEAARSPLDRMKEGEMYTVDGLPLAHAIDWRSVSVSDFAQIISKLEDHPHVVRDEPIDTLA